MKIKDKCLGIRVLTYMTTVTFTQESIKVHKKSFGGVNGKEKNKSVKILVSSLLSKVSRFPDLPPWYI